MSTKLVPLSFICQPMTPIQVHTGELSATASLVTEERTCSASSRSTTTPMPGIHSFLVDHLPRSLLFYRASLCFRQYTELYSTVCRLLTEAHVCEKHAQGRYMIEREFDAL